MPWQPSANEAHYDELMTSFSLAYEQDQEVYIADKVLTPMPVDRYTGHIRTIAKNTYFRSGMEPRADGTESAGIGRKIDRVRYETENFAVHDDVTEREIAKAAEPYQPMIEAQESVTDSYMIYKEEMASEFLFTTSNWTPLSTAVAGFTKWTASGSTPIEDMLDICMYVRRKTGKRPNTVVVAPEVHKVLRLHEDVQKWAMRLDAGGAQKLVSHMHMAELFEVMNYYEIGAVHDTENDGEPGEGALDFIREDGLWVGYVHPGPMTGKANTAGARVRWTGSDATEGDMDHRINTFYLPETKVTRVEIEAEWQFLALAPDLAVCGEDVI